MANLDIQARLAAARARVDDIRPKVVDRLLKGEGPVGLNAHGPLSILSNPRPLAAARARFQERVASVAPGVAAKLPRKGEAILGGAGSGQPHPVVSHKVFGPPSNTAPGAVIESTPPAFLGGGQPRKFG